MDVHVPEAGDQELAAGIDYSTTLRYRYFASFSEISDLVTGDDNSHIRLRWTAGNIDDREMSQDQSFLLSVNSPVHEWQGEQQEKKGNDFCHVKSLILDGAGQDVLSCAQLQAFDATDSERGAPLASGLMV
jgi:hypothetical protein